MFKKILLTITLLYAAAVMAAVDVNKANEAELDGIKGIGPALTAKILDERKSGQFKDWNDFIARVSGVGEKTAARYSAEGLTVNGKKFNAASAAKANAKTAEAQASAKDTRPGSAKTASQTAKAKTASDAARSPEPAPAATAPAVAAPDAASKK